MAGQRTRRASWRDPSFYPIDDNLVQGARTEDDAVFLVDVGGGKGYDLQELCRKHSKLPGTLILQDIEGVIDEAEASGLNEKIIAMKHDFFTKQPIIGMWKHEEDLSAKIPRCPSLLHAFLFA